MVRSLACLRKIVLGYFNPSPSFVSPLQFHLAHKLDLEFKHNVVTTHTSMLISAHANGALIKVLYVDIHFTVLVFLKQTTVLVPTNYES